MNFRFQNLLGALYRGGNIVISDDTLLSPVSNRVASTDIVKSQSLTLPFVSSSNISRIAVSPDGVFLLVVDNNSRALFVNLRRRAVLHRITFKRPVTALLFSPDGSLIVGGLGKLLPDLALPRIPQGVLQMGGEVQLDQAGSSIGSTRSEGNECKEEVTSLVLVMTAQILLNILRHSIIRMEAIHLLILDECHHAVKKHPYSLVMSEFYHTTPKDKRPAVFGMTASPVNLKGVSSQMDCAIKIQNLESKLDVVVYTVKDRKELEKHVPMPSEEVVQYDKAPTLWSLHEQIKQMETAVEEAAHSSSRRSKWQFMGARDAGSKEELRLVYGVSERTESDGAANLIQKLRAINYALGELGQWCAYKVAQSFLTALQNDERANYQLDVKFQVSYLKKVVALLQCQLVEGAADNKDAGTADVNTCEGQGEDDIEEGELPDSHERRLEILSKVLLL